MSDSFKNINSRIQEFLTELDFDAYELDDTEYKLPFSDALFCAQDAVRNRAFYEAIEKALSQIRQTKSTIVMVDAGSGTGILGALGLMLGADKCYFLEHNPYSLTVSRKLLTKLELLEKCEFVECDATEYQMPETFDLMVNETMSSGFVTEDFPYITNHLRPFANSGAIFIPERFEITATEEDEKGQAVSKHHFGFETENGFPETALCISSGNSKQLRWHTKAILFDDISLQTGETMSFLNERVSVIQGLKHGIFKIEE